MADGSSAVAGLVGSALASGAGSTLPGCSCSTRGQSGCRTQCVCRCMVVLSFGGAVRT